MNRYYQTLSQIYQGSANIQTNILNLETFPKYDITQNQVYSIQFDTERAQPNYKEGMSYPKRGVLKLIYLNIKNKSNNSLIESSYVEYEPQIRKDNTFSISVINCYAGQNSRGMRFQLTLNYDITAGDEIRIEFQMNDEINQIFIPYLGFSSIRQKIQCQENSSPKAISLTPLECYLQENQIRIPIKQNIATKTFISFWISNIQNPQMKTTVGVYLKIMTYCRGNIERNEHRCILYHSKNYYITKSLPSTGVDYKLQASEMLPSSNIVTLKASHSYKILFEKVVPPLKDILLTYPDNHIHSLPCSSLQGQCQILNTRSLIYKPNVSISAGSTFTFTLDDVYNGISLSSHSLDDFIYVEIYDNATSLIDQAYKIIIKPYLPYQAGIGAVIQNTQTQNSFLKSSFKNIAFLKVQNIWRDENINNFVILKPSVIYGFIGQQYCNATLSIPSPNPYPIGLICTISQTGNAIFIQTENIIFDPSYSTFALQVHFKLIIDDKFPPEGVPVGFTDDLQIYGCVRSCDTVSPSRYYQTLATTRLYVSDAKVPYYANIFWNQKAFHQSKAIFSREARFSGVIQPSSLNNLINRIKLNIEDSFKYPPVLQIKGCRIYTNLITYPLDSCKLNRQQGNSQIEIVLSTGYFLSYLPHFIYIETLDQEFTAPEYPGQHYQIRASLFEKDQSTPLEETQVFLSRVIGYYFDRSKLTFLNGLDSKLTNLNEINFETSFVTIPQGYIKNITSQMHSEIHILFEWIPNGFNQGQGYSNVMFFYKKNALIDIGSGLKDGEEIGCLSKSGLKFRENEGIKCQLKIAQKSDETSCIRIMNYEQIDPFTKINIMFIGIQSLDMNEYSLIKIAVELVFDSLEPIVPAIRNGLKSNFYSQEINRSYLYMPSPLIPDKTSAQSIFQNINPTVVTKYGSTTTQGYSDFEFTFTLGNRNLKPTDYIEVIFPSGSLPNHIVDFSNVSCPQGQAVYVFGKKSQIFIQPLVQINSNSVFSFRINNLANPYYTVPKSELQINLYTFIDRKQDTQYVFKLANYYNDYNNAISNTQLRINSTIAGNLNVRYNIQFQLNQYLPSNGIIQIIFPTIVYKSLYKIKRLSCYLEGFYFNSKCQVGGYNKLNLFLIGLQIKSTSLYNIIIDNITNPIADLAEVIEQQYFQLAIYYNSIYLQLNQPISMVIVGYPVINQIQVRPINFRLFVDYPIFDIESLYNFEITCDFDIPENTRIVILLGQSYSHYDDSKRNDIECSSPYITSNVCQISYSVIEKKFILEVYTTFVPQMKPFNIIAKIINPRNDISSLFYILKLYEENKSTLFATSTINYLQKLQQTVQFYQSEYNEQNKSDIQIFIDSFILTQNIPNQSNQQSYYIFQVSQNNDNTLNLFSKTLTEVLITLKFPPNFSNMNGYKQNIELFIHYDQNDNKIYNISQIEELISSFQIKRVSSTYSKDYQIQNTLVLMMQLKSNSQKKQIYNNSWNYLIVKNVINPQIYKVEDFQIMIFDPTSAFQKHQLSFNKKFRYEITNENPCFICVSEVQIKSLFFNVKTDYVFTIDYHDNLNKVLHTGVRYLILLTLPKQLIIKAQSTHNCFIQGNQNAIKSDSQKCSIFLSAEKSTVIALQVIFTKLISSSFQFVVIDLINPSPSFDSIQKNQFSIKIIEDNSNQIICSDTHSYVSSQNKYSQQIQYIATPSLNITVVGAVILERGFKYDYKITIEKPAKSLVITPIILDYETQTVVQSSYILITPKIIKFQDFKNNLTKFFTLSFSFNYPLTETLNQSLSQSFIIRFQQLQDAQFDEFNNISDVNIQIQNEIKDEPFIQVNINDLDVNTQGYPFFIKASISSLPASIIYIGLRFDTNDNLYQEKYASKLQIKNKLLKIDNKKDYEFEVQYIDDKIPKPIPLSLYITSQDKQINDLYQFIPSNKFYLVFTKSPAFGKEIARVQIMEFVPDYMFQFIADKPMAFKSFPQYSPQILKSEQQASQISKNEAIFNPCKIKYFVVLGQEKNDPKEQNFISDYYEKSIFQGSIYTRQFSDILLDNVQEIRIENLKLSEYYSIYFMAQNAMGYSKVVMKSFMTNDISQPCSLFLQFLDQINEESLIPSISKILRISIDKIMLLNATDYRNNSLSSFGIKNTKHILIIPDEKESYNPQNLLESNLKQIENQLKMYIPQFDAIQEIYISNNIASMPVFKSEPKIIELNIYDVKIEVETSVQSTIFVIVLQELQENLKPQQISRCLDGYNQQVDQVHCVKIQTNPNGMAIVSIDFLKEDTQYYVYFAASAFTPYEYPVHYSKNLQKIYFNTYQNPNINQCGLYKILKNSNEKLASALQKYSDDEYVYC